jgi:hypothetical protein
MIVSLVGLLLSILAIHIFWSALNRPLTHNLHLTGIMSMLLLSLCGLLLSAVFLMLGLWKHNPQLRRYAYRLYRRTRGAQPSAFAHDWHNRASASYEDSRRYRRERGQQAGFRLKYGPQSPAPTGRDGKPRNGPVNVQSRADPAPGNRGRSEPDSVC